MVASSWLVAGLIGLVGLGFHLSSEVDWRTDFQFPVGHVVSEVVVVVGASGFGGGAGLGCQVCHDVASASRPRRLSID